MKAMDVLPILKEKVAYLSGKTDFLACFDCLELTEAAHLTQHKKALAFHGLLKLVF